MIGRDFIIKTAESFSEHNTKYFAWKFLIVTSKSSKKRNDFTQLWRQGPCV